jgi:hypothetical protein
LLPGACEAVLVVVSISELSVDYCIPQAGCGQDDSDVREFELSAPPRRPRNGVQDGRCESIGMHENEVDWRTLLTVVAVAR